MNILMMTNTYTPHVGGVARSVETFTEEYRKLGHRVLVVTPDFEGEPEVENGVVRVPAIQHFNSTDFSLSIPLLDVLALQLEDFDPDIVHSHHPFWLGDTALRVAARRGLPLVFTNHTMYESYTHYMPGDSTALKKFVTSLATGYANLCNRVIAPSESVADMLEHRGVKTPVSIIPTGIDVDRFARGDGKALRQKLRIPDEAFVVGHVGRLAHEKNLAFLGRAVGAFLWQNPEAQFLVVGSGPAREEIETFFRQEEMADRVHFLGVLEGRELINAYHAMDVFCFASRTETQGLVLAEAMAAEVPVVAVDAPGVREVVQHGVNGRMISYESMFAFAAELVHLAELPREHFEYLRRGALRTAQEYSHHRCARRALKLYDVLIEESARPREAEGSPWASAMRLIKAEWDHWQNVAGAAGTALAALLTGAESGHD